MGTDLGDVVQDHRNALYWLQEVQTTQLTESEEVSKSEEAPVIASNEVAVHNGDVIKTVAQFLL